MIRKLGFIILSLALALLACTKDITKKAAPPPYPDTKSDRNNSLDSGDEPFPDDVSNMRSSLQSINENSASVTRFEKIPAGEQRLIKDMAFILREKVASLEQAYKGCEKESFYTFLS